MQHEIDVQGHPPIRLPFRRISPNKLDELRVWINDIIDKSIITESYSPSSRPIVLVKKKDSTTRFCVDYRQVNAVTGRDAYSLSRIDDSMDSLSGSSWFTSLDFTSGYWQVKIKKRDREKTAFITPLGLFEWHDMPFGLTNAPATFHLVGWTGPCTDVEQ